MLCGYRCGVMIRMVHGGNWLKKLGAADTMVNYFEGYIIGMPTMWIQEPLVLTKYFRITGRYRILNVNNIL